MLLRTFVLVSVGLPALAGDSPALRGGLLRLPPAPAELAFGDFFKSPIGPRGLEYTDALRRLDAGRVCIEGYMVRQCEPTVGMFLLSPVPVTLHEHEYGLCDDLPASTLHVLLPRSSASRRPAFTPVRLQLTGTLRVGSREEADGRISVARLELDSLEPSPGHPK